MNSARKQRREVARWEASTRAWATGRGKDLALELYQQADVAVAPYSVGLVFEQAGEIVGCRVDLTVGREAVQIDLNGMPPILWTGPGVGPSGGRRRIPLVWPSGHAGPSGLGRAPRGKHGQVEAADVTSPTESAAGRSSSASTALSSTGQSWSPS